jgi:hypothetical protein
MRCGLRPAADRSAISASHLYVAVHPHDERDPPRELRKSQEQEISLGFSLATAEHALAREACSIARVFEAAGIAFDPLTFVALRVVEASDEDHVDAVECLELLVRFGFLERSVALAEHLLEDAA